MAIWWPVGGEDSFSAQAGGELHKKVFPPKRAKRAVVVRKERVPYRIIRPPLKAVNKKDIPLALNFFKTRS